MGEIAALNHIAQELSGLLEQQEQLMADLAETVDQ